MCSGVRPARALAPPVLGSGATDMAPCLACSRLLRGRPRPRLRQPAWPPAQGAPRVRRAGPRRGEQGERRARGIATYASSARVGYDLSMMVLITISLIVVQEMVARMGKRLAGQGPRRADPRAGWVRACRSLSTAAVLVANLGICISGVRRGSARPRAPTHPGADLGLDRGRRRPAPRRARLLQARRGRPFVAMTSSSPSPIAG